MIFVTVGTHEQPFDRLVKAVDELKGQNIITRDVFIQTGYSSYKPRHCDHADFIGFGMMLRRMEEAEMVITHGGTGSIMLVLYKNKIPVVMPRQKKYNEHIDDHQVHFCRTMATKRKIIPVYETEDLETVITTYARRSAALQKELAAGNLNERAGLFARKLDELCSQLTDKTNKK
ncbi:MAG: multidrug MFS transporter [bacterium]|nr:multidrug MFS transporter [bacterium]